jgi:thiamine pyrophosphokinase
MADDEAQRDAIVVTGAAPLDERSVAELPPGAYIVAADGGLDHALAAGLHPDALVGDLDSVSAAGLAWAHTHASVHTHATDKATTDTELAIEHALGIRPRRLILIAGVGDRLDHSIAAVGALGAATLAPVESVEGWWGSDHLLVVTPQRPAAVDAPAGTTFSVLAMHGPASGVTITGARWPLDGVELAPLVGLGVSNTVVEPPARVTVGTGLVTVIVNLDHPPGAES